MLSVQLSFPMGPVPARGRIFIVLLLLVQLFLENVHSRRNGMAVRPFEGMNGILEVECSGETLDFNIDILTMGLFVDQSSDVLAFVNLGKNQCTTDEQFSACIIDPGFSRKTKLKTLVVDLKEGQSRKYGCNMTVLRSGRAWTENIAWVVLARRERPAPAPCCFTFPDPEQGHVPICIWVDWRLTHKVFMNLRCQTGKGKLYLCTMQTSTKPKCTS